MNTNRRLFVLGAAGLLAPGAFAQRSVARHVGVLTGTNEAFFERARAGFEDALRRMGWRPHENLVLHYRYSVGDEGAAYRALAELMSAQVEVLVAAGALPLATLRSVTPSTAVVALFDADPVATGLAASLSRPGGNITGVAGPDARQETTKLMETVREAFPKLRRLGILYRGQPPGMWREERSAAAAFGIELLPVEAEAGRIEAAVAELVRRRADAAWVLFDPSWSIPETAATLRSARMPAISDVLEFVDSGGLMAFGVGVEMVAVFQQLARLVDRVLRGVPPGQLPIETPGSPRLAVNARTAREIDYRIPPSILVKADRLVD